MAEHLCPCCAKYAFSEEASYDICPVCGWEDDPVQAADPGYAGGANKESLLEARLHWRTHGTPLPSKGRRSEEGRGFRALGRHHE